MLDTFPSWEMTDTEHELPLSTITMNVWMMTEMDVTISFVILVIYLNSSIYQSENEELRS
jgi:hypothetical protein